MSANPVIGIGAIYLVAILIGDKYSDSVHPHLRSPGQFAAAAVPNIQAIPRLHTELVTRMVINLGLRFASANVHREHRSVNAGSKR